MPAVLVRELLVRLRWAAASRHFLRAGRGDRVRAAARPGARTTGTRRRRPHFDVYRCRVHSGRTNQHSRYQPTTPATR